MEKIKIITDTPCDIDINLEEKLDITIVSIPVNIDGKEYLEARDMPKEEFLSLLENCGDNLPTTTQITYFTWMGEFEKAKEEGYTHIICIPICSSGSGTYNQSLMAKNMFLEKYGQDSMNFNIVDAKTYSVGYGRLVREAVDMRKDGVSFNKISERLDYLVKKVEIILVPYALDFARKSGRISCAAALLGGLLGLKPIITMIDGVSTIIAKVRGNKSVIEKVVNHIKNNIDPDELSVDIVCGHIDGEEKNLEKALREEYGDKIKLEFWTLGNSIALNAGPKALGLSYYSKNVRENS